MHAPESSGTPVFGCLPRLFWMIGGVVILFFVSLGILRTPSFSVYDAAFAATLAAMILARFLDIRYLNGETADGNPATMRDWRRYSVVLTAASFGCWLSLHAIAWLMRP